MSNAVCYRRLTDTNQGLFGGEHQTSIEAGFCRLTDGALVLSIRILNSQEIEIFRSNHFNEISPEILQKYQKWNPTQNLNDFVRQIEAQKSPGDESAYFLDPFFDVCLEVKMAPVAPTGYWMQVSMGTFTVLGDYQWRDSSKLHLTMICNGDALFDFLQYLRIDLQQILCESMSKAD